VKKIKSALNLLFGEMTWVMGLASVLSIATYVTIILYNILIPSLHIVAAVTICSFAFINAYILVVGLLFRIIVRPLKEGRYKVNSKKHMMWRLNWNFYSYVFLFLRQYLFYNKTIRFLFFKLLRVNLHYSTYFAETVDMQDANNLLYFGKNAAIGSEVLLSTHLALDAHVHILKKLIVGENTQIQARSCLAPGARIGNNVIIGFGNRVSVDVVIGDHTRTGVDCIFHYGAKIGQNCRIGHGVIVDEYSVIQDNTCIDDFEHVQKSLPTLNPKIHAIHLETIDDNIDAAPAAPLFVPR
jgi:acetyltransferase-like isoleucine patch superfamily enzyme